MARTRKYPQWSSSGENEVPYDSENFKRWMVNSQGLTISTAKAYVYHIQNAAAMLFDEDDKLFKNLRDVFESPNYSDIEARISAHEYNINLLYAYIEVIEKYGERILNDSDSHRCRGKKNKATVSTWLTSFKAYTKYINWKTDGELEILGIPMTVDNDPDFFLELPLSNEFRYYLDNIGAGYEVNSIDTYYSKLKRVYNLLFRRIQGIDIIQLIPFAIECDNPMWEFCAPLTTAIDHEIENPRFNDLSEDDLRRGKRAFLQYLDFLKDYAENPEKYTGNPLKHQKKRNSNKSKRYSFDAYPFTDECQ